MGSRASLLLALLSAWSDPAAAGVWVRDAGEAWLQGSLSGSTSTSMFAGNGTLRDTASAPFVGDVAPLFERSRYLGLDLSTYGEVGLGRGVEVVASAPIRYTTQAWHWSVGASDPIVHRNLGFGDLALGGRIGTVLGGVALSLYAGGRVPLYDNAPDALGTAPGNSDFYDNRIPLGQGTIDGEALAGLGTGLGLWDGWVLFEGGVRGRNRRYSTQLPGRLQLGVQPGPISPWIGASGTVSLGNGAAPDFFLDAYGKGPTVPDNASWLTAEAGLLAPVRERWNVVASVSRVVTARRYPALTQGTVGLAWVGPMWGSP